MTTTLENCMQSGMLAPTQMNGLLPRSWEDTHKKDMGGYNPVERIAAPRNGYGGGSTFMIAQKAAAYPTASMSNSYVQMSDPMFVKKTGNVSSAATDAQGNAYIVEAGSSADAGGSFDAGMPTSASGLLSLPVNAKEWAGVAVGALVVAIAARKMLNTGPVTTIASVVVGAIAGKIVSSKI